MTTPQRRMLRPAAVSSATAPVARALPARPRGHDPLPAAPAGATFPVTATAAHDAAVRGRLRRDRPAGDAGHPGAARRDDLAVTTRAGTWVDRARLAPGAAARVAAHEQVHAQQFVLGLGGAAPASPQALEQEAQAGAEAVLSGGVFTPRLAAPEDAVLAFHPDTGLTELPSGHDPGSDPDVGPTGSGPEPTPREEFGGVGDPHELTRPVEVVRSVHRAEPAVVVVDAVATRAEIAEALYGNPGRTDAFDWVDPVTVPELAGVLAGGDVRGVRPRDPAALTAEVLGLVRPMMEAALSRDEAATVSDLSERVIDDADEWRLVERVHRWAQRSAFRDAGGTSYFDRYLLALDGRVLVQGDWYTLTLTDTRRSALQWLLVETAEKAEQVHKQIALRSERFRTGYAVTDTTPELSPWDVVGRFYWSSGSGMQLRVHHLIAEDRDPVALEIRARNDAWQGLRILVPGTDGIHRAYAVVHPALDLLVQGPTEGAPGRYFWYHPGTVLIPAGESTPDVHQGGERERTLRTGLLRTALAEATPDHPQPLLGLQVDVLAQATVEQRIEIATRLLDSVAAGSPTVPAVLTRVLLSTPTEQFLRLERRLSTEGVLARLLGMDQRELLGFARVFTVMSVSTMAIGGGAFDAMPSITVGKVGERYQWAFGGATTVRSQVVGDEDWAAEEAPSVEPGRAVAGREHAMPGEAPGTIDRTAITLVPQSSTTSWHEGVTTEASLGPFLPAQLITVHIAGPTPETRIVSAFEAAAITSSAVSEWLHLRAVNQLAAASYANAGVRLAGAFGPALARGLVAGGLRAGLRALATHAATQAGRTALRTFVAETVLIGTMQVVESHRSDLQRSEAGRAFLAVYDVAMVAMAAHGAWRLLTSGVVRRVAALGLAALRAVPPAVAAGLRRAVVELEALQRAFTRMRTAGELVAVTDNGVRVLRPVSEETFQRAYMTAHADIAAEGLMATLGGAGVSTARATRVLDALRAAAQAGGQQSARAFRAIATHAGTLGAAAADAFLARVEQLLATRPAQAGALADLLRAAPRAADPMAFLDDAIWLAGQPGISREALTTLGAKALRGPSTLDLAWLRTQSLGTRLINFLGKDPKTPWNLLRRASADPSDVDLRIQLLRRIRGIAGERVAEQTVGRGPMSGYRVAQRQVATGSSELDFRLLSTDGRAASAFLEVKAWTPDVWRRSIEAFERRTAGFALTEAEAGFAGRIDTLRRQVADAAAAGRDAPFLAVPDSLPAALRTRLTTIVRTGTPSVRIVTISDTEIVTTGRTIRTGLGIP